MTLRGGTLTLALTEDPSPVASAAEFERFSFTITKGTGKFHNAGGDPVGKGTVDVFLRPGKGGTPFLGHGGVTLVFHSIPVPVA